MELIHETYEEYEKWFKEQGYPEHKKATYKQWALFNRFLLGETFKKSEEKH